MFRQVLADPTLEVRDVNGALIASNDNGKDSQQTESGERICSAQ
jgi:hypothetical protein